ncbi:MAG: S8 family serine peptidase [Acidobacteriota bacterium]
MESRNPVAGVRLNAGSRDFSGLDPELSGRLSSGASPALVIASWDDFPSAADWRAWQAQGLSYVEYLDNRHWLMQLSGDAGAAYSASGARALFLYRGADKIAPELSAESLDERFFDSEQNLVVVDAQLVPGLSSSARQELVREFAAADASTAEDRSEARLITLVMRPHRIEDLAMNPGILTVNAGSWELEPLMSGVRPAVHGDLVFGLQREALSGRGIRVATNERLSAGASHEGFWSHKPSGQLDSPRWTDVAENSCIHTSSPTAWHGMMSAGILMGNGWFSDRNGGESPLIFRGLAPEATLECYHHTGARAHASSHSYVGSDVSWDRSVVGELSEERFHAHVAACGNSGLSEGYYSLRNHSKNSMVVANSQVRGAINPTSSAGPTSDGRLKPDITAPTSNYEAYRSVGFSLEVDSVRLRRNGTTLIEWNSNALSPGWHQGWGQPGHPFGQVFAQISAALGGRMRIDVQPGPWGTGWVRSPLIGTQEYPPTGLVQGPLNIQGHEDDVVEIRYRALTTGYEGLGYFDLQPIWFRCFPSGNGCTGSEFWHSQGQAGGLGIGDGEWRTLEVPVGLAAGAGFSPNPFWDDEETWAGESIQWLGLRLRRVHAQPTPSHSQAYHRASGGTSGASPVVGGAYALAMEHLTQLYSGSNVDLDVRDRPSVYSEAGIPSLVKGMPWNSTWKAIFIQTARDMIRTRIPADTPPNPDTGIPNLYHRGPDYTTGYGLLDVQAGIDLMTREATGKPAYEIIENAVQGGHYHGYTFHLQDYQVSSGVAATLVWDDEPNSQGSLVNNLGLILIDPNGEVFYPWSLDVPAEPVSAADIVPARQDQPNDRDNVEKVEAIKLTADQAGLWRAYVIDHGMAGLAQEQSYSLVISPID